MKRFWSGLTSPVFWKVVLPFLLVLFTLGIGTIGFYESYAPVEPISVKDAFLLASGLPLMETTNTLPPGDYVSIRLEVARLTGLLIPPYAFLLLLFTVFNELVKQLRVLRWRISPWINHTVVCGLGWTGSEIVHDLREPEEGTGRKARKVAVIDKDRDAPFRSTLERRGVVFFGADATGMDILKKAGASSAEKMYVVCNDDEVNCRVVNQIALLCPKRQKAGICYVHIDEHRKRDFLARFTKSTQNLKVMCFNTYETTARQFIETHPINRFSSDDNGGAKNVHVVIMGFTPMARAILRQTLQVGHFKREQRGKISLMAFDVEKCRKTLLEEYPCLDPEFYRENEDVYKVVRYAIPEVTLEELPLSDSRLLHEDFPLYKGITKDWITTIFVCLDDGLTSAGYLSAMAPKLEALRKDRGCDVKACLYYNIPNDKQETKTEDVQEGFRKMVPDLDVVAFGDLLEDSSVEIIEGNRIDDLARQIAALYESEYGGPKWDDLSEEDKETNRRAADHIRVKLLSIGVKEEEILEGSAAFRFTENQMDELAEMEHRRWCAEKLIDGWMPLSPNEQNKEAWQKNKEALKRQKLHICLVPYEDVDPDEKRKDYQQIEAIPKLLKKLSISLSERRAF